MRRLLWLALCALALAPHAVATPDVLPTQAGLSAADLRAMATRLSALAAELERAPAHNATPMATSKLEYLHDSLQVRGVARRVRVRATACDAVPERMRHAPRCRWTP
jgi:hypothetical protein